MRAQVERALAAIPITREHHRLRLGDLQPPGGIQTRLDVEPVPMQLTLRERNAGYGQRQQDAQRQTGG